MSDSTITSSNYNPQIASGLFHIPIELRHEIYFDLIGTTGLHITRSKSGGFRLSSCWACDLDAELLGFECRPRGIVNSEVWRRRLLSPWGRHWQCEEIVSEEAVDNKDPLDIILRVCKLM
ncbi:hypothetical protein PFICI_04315 [Pestalotiopsis fici W106-1]|uniref:Uncharacterized protein n=1 Tax=Pestalotiopsis fici (strain W106-1 / CGMCC3.15140) TaxID=1229662 RepID=W3X8T5_PESFW|nr:uncharacterized protein PFICI_04315 [Pestalotiopsis fici W106-1]ETS82439.1 hypothetical protein PFICI_04315 [Pestalotiopsis fici W106-1]